MIPDIALRLQSMERALREVVIPALPEGSYLAREQAHLVVAYIRLLSRQHPYALHYEMAELHEFAQLLRDLVKSAADGCDRTGAALDEAKRLLERIQPLLNVHVPFQQTVVEAVRAADALVRAAEAGGSATRRDATMRLVLAQSAREIERARAWNAAAGLDREASRLPSLETILSTR
jgi:uncharacterized protein YecE (DUF72 family)